MDDLLWIFILPRPELKQKGKYIERTVSSSSDLK